MRNLGSVTLIVSGGQKRVLEIVQIGKIPPVPNDQGITNKGTGGSK